MNYEQALTWLRANPEVKMKWRPNWVSLDYTYPCGWELHFAAGADLPFEKIFCHMVTEFALMKEHQDQFHQ